MPLDRTVSIGRDEHNLVAIPDPGLSRRHCAIEMTDQQFVLRDLDSKNGVFVNGCPISERRLVDGDQIRIGDSAMVVMLPPDDVAPRATDSDVTFVETPFPTTSMVVMEGARRRYYDEQAADRDAARAMRDLALLFRLSDVVQTITTLDSLYDALLQHALEVGHADGASILMASPADEALMVASSRAVAGKSVTISRAVAEQAITDHAAVSASDAATVCVPLVGSGTARGALCLNPAGAARFADEDLRLLAAMGSIGGLALQRIRHLEWINGENARLRQDAAIEHSLVGESAAIKSVHRFIAKVAPTDATVLLRGESGTGKELVAHAIHHNSSRANGPFVAINCAALPEALLESELFGHERGAFTGAISQQRGRLEMADRGTVFLDEVGELAPPLQAKLLRVLQDQVVERVGARRGIKIDVRVIAATNRDLESAIAGSAFRKDLYYRLNVVSVTIPALRDRRDDLPLLAAYFVRKHSASCKRPVRGISPEARTLLTRYEWPGNVRELSNAIERAVVLGSTDLILAEDLPEAIVESAYADNAAEGFHGQVAAAKRELISGALARHGGNVAATARELDLQPTYLHRLIRNLGIRHFIG